MLEIGLDVCVGCGSRDFRRSRLQGVIENLASPFLVPYRCRSCERRQFKLAWLRVSCSKKVIVSEATSKVSQESPVVPSQVVPASQVPELPPDPPEPIEAAPAAPQDRQSRAWLSRLAASLFALGARLRGIAAHVLRVRRFALWTAISVVCLELILQTTALAMWYGNRPRQQHLILCIGDSYTFGTGATASEFSYPSTLGKLLRKTDQSWQVVNAGWPDRDSRDTVYALSDHLLHYRPAKVYIVAGARDVLTLPKAAPTSISESVTYSFPIAFRTGQLFQDFAKWGNVKSSEASEFASDWLRVQRLRWNRSFGPSPAGTWLYRGRVVRIQDNGMVRFGDVISRWETKGNQLNLIPAKGVVGAAMHYRWERRKQSLFIKGGNFPTGLILEPLTEGEARRLEADALRGMPRPGIAARPSGAAGSASESQTELEEKLRLAMNGGQPGARFFLRSRLTRTYARNGRRGAATMELAQMRSEMDSAGDPEPMVETYVDTAEFIDEGARALSAARTFAPRYASNAVIEKTIAWESYRNRDFNAAVAAIEKALSLAGKGNARAAILNVRARIFLGKNPSKSLESLIQAYETNGDLFALRSQLQTGLGVYDPELVNVSLDNLKAPPDVREAVRKAIRELKLAPDYIGTALARNLRLMADMVRATGAEVVFVSYPHAEADRVNEVIRQVASEKHAGLIDIESTFAQHVESTPTMELFEPDGHLTNQGYGLVADLVAADVSRRKQ